MLILFTDFLSSEKRDKMTAPELLANKCLEFCQALASQNTTFSFNLTCGPSFSFSLDTRGVEPPTKNMVRKQVSPSTRRRNERRKKVFLEKKNSTTSVPVKETNCEVSAKEAEDKKQTNWNSELVECDSGSVIMKLKKAKNNIPQFDGNIDDATADAEVQTEEKHEVKQAATQTIKPAHELGIWSMSWSTEAPRPPTHMGPYPKTNMGPYPKTNMGPYKPPHHR